LGGGGLGGWGGWGWLFWVSGAKGTQTLWASVRLKSEETGRFKRRKGPPVSESTRTLEKTLNKKKCPERKGSGESPPALGDHGKLEGRKGCVKGDLERPGDFTGFREEKRVRIREKGLRMSRGGRTAREKGDSKGFSFLIREETSNTRGGEFSGRDANPESSGAPRKNLEGKTAVSEMFWKGGKLEI